MRFCGFITRHIRFRRLAVKFLAVLIVIVCVSLPPLTVFRPENSLSTRSAESSGENSGEGFHRGGKAYNPRDDFATVLAHLDELTPPVRLTPPPALEGWLPVADREWRDPRGVVLAGGWQSSLPSPAPNQPLSSVFHASSQVACAQLIVKDIVNNILGNIALALKKIAHALHLDAIIETSAARQGQAAAHHKENLIQAAARHAQRISMKLNEMMALVKKGVYIFRSLTTARGIYNLFMEHLQLSEDVKKLIADMYDLYATARQLHQSVEDAFELAYQFQGFFKDFRSWYRDANPEALLDLLDHFLSTYGGDEHARREHIRALVDVYPEFRKYYELYLAHAGQALEQRKIYEQLLAKIEEHKAELKKENEIVGKTPEEIAPTTPDNNTTPAPIPPQGSPERQNAANTNYLLEALTLANEEMRKHQEQCQKIAYELSSALDALYEELNLLMQRADDAALLEDELRDYFDDKNGSVDMLRLYFCLVFLDCGKAAPVAGN